MFKHIIQKYKDVLPYTFFGILTTVINIMSYILFAHLLNISVITSTILAWFISTTFAYITNRKWVFFSEVKTKKEILNEALNFFYCRIGTGLIDIVLMWFFVNRLHLSDICIKVLANIIVIILNYIASKWLIFSHDKNGVSQNKKLAINITILLIIGVVAFLIAEFDAQSPWHHGDMGIDSSVYKYIVQEMQQGNMPYLDTFDHKGPLLFILLYVGYAISPSHGGWIITFAAMFFTVLFAYLTARKMKLGYTKSILCTIICATPICSLFAADSGQTPQSLIMPFLAASTYIFFDYYINDKISNIRLLISGMCLGAAFMLLGNVLVIWVAFAILAVVYCIKRKEAKKILTYALSFIAGVIIVVFPILIWLLINGAFTAFLDCVFTFNALYSTENPITSSFIVFFDFIKMSIILISLASLVYRVIKQKQFIDIASLTLIMVAYALACMSGRPYPHYEFYIVPLLFYPVTSLIKQFSSNRKIDEITSFVVIGYILIAIVLPQWADAGKNLAKTFLDRNIDKTNPVTNETSRIIQLNSDTDDKISVYGNSNSIYLKSNRFSASRYSYQIPLINIDGSIHEKYLDDLKQNKPKLVVIVNNQFDKKSEKYKSDLLEFLKNNSYQNIWQSAKLPDNDSNDIDIYKFVQG